MSYITNMDHFRWDQLKTKEILWYLSFLREYYNLNTSPKLPLSWGYKNRYKLEDYGDLNTFKEVIDSSNGINIHKNELHIQENEQRKRRRRDDAFLKNRNHTL